MGWDSSVGIATLYGVDGPGFEYQWERDFSHPSRTTLWPTLFPAKMALGLFPRGKAAGVWF